MMDVNALLQSLGYLRSARHWVTGENADPRLAHYYRLAHRAGAEAGEGAGVVGSYVFTASTEDRVLPPRPAVFVAYAADETQAREIHRHFWNIGDCPFVMIVLPGTIRVYTGFDYSHHDPKRGMIVGNRQNSPVLSLDEELPDALTPFHADRIDSGRIWEEQAKRLSSKTRVDYHLLTNLKRLSAQLQASPYSLTREVAHALIGKYIYLRYLRDRAILDDDWLAMQQISPESVFGRSATATGFERLTQALQAQFNGAIFPLPTEDDGQWRVNGAIPFLAATFHGDTSDGQLALDFGAYDFSYVPTELLSSVYEQFLKAEGRGEDEGVVYTPEALADYMLAEMEAVSPLQLTHRVLDPCCGSGVFLVLAYRRMIEKLRQEQGSSPSADALKRLLQSGIFGVEQDPEACEITAFSLILTLLSHLEPPELRANSDFQFPTLVGENIYPADFFDPACPVFALERRFDWIVGNPPWTSADESNSKHAFAWTWIKDAAKQGRSVGERRLDEAFLWRAADLLSPNGYAALLIKATSLVNSSSSVFRKAFFKQHEVPRVSNLTHLQRILFSGPEGKRAEAPAACLIYRNAMPGGKKPAILHFGPFVADQVFAPTKSGQQRVWTLTLYESDIQTIDSAEAAEDAPCLWKTALWGSFLDRRTLSRLRRLMPHTVEELATQRGWTLCSGPHIKSAGKQKSKGEFVSTPQLKNQLLLETKDLHTKFTIDEHALTPLPPERQYIKKRFGSKGLKLIPAPHIAIAVELAVYSDQDFVIPTPKVGIAASSQDADYLKAVALYLNSSVARYAQFFESATWGISIDKISPDNVGSIPFVDVSVPQIKTLAATYDQLADSERSAFAAHAPLEPPPVDYQSEVDTVVEATLGIPESIGGVAREFMQVRYQLNRGRAPETALQPPSDTDLQRYAEQLRQQIDTFTRRCHRVSISAGWEAVVATVEVTNASEALPVEISREGNTTARLILHAANEQHSQWTYIQRSVRVFDGPRVHIVKAARLLDWTRTQAIQDAADLIAEVLDKTTPQYEPTAA